MAGARAEAAAATARAGAADRRAAAAAEAIGAASDGALRERACALWRGMCWHSGLVGVGALLCLNTFEHVRLCARARWSVWSFTIRCGRAADPSVALAALRAALTDSNARCGSLEAAAAAARGEAAAAGARAAAADRRAAEAAAAPAARSGVCAGFVFSMRFFVLTFSVFAVSGDAGAEASLRAALAEEADRSRGLAGELQSARQVRLLTPRHLATPL